jgi:hypothetical protein
MNNKLLQNDYVIIWGQDSHVKIITTLPAIQTVREIDFRHQTEAENKGKRTDRKGDKNTSKVNFASKVVWCLRSGVQRLNCSYFTQKG